MVTIAVMTGDRRNSGAARRALDIEVLIRFASKVCDRLGVPADVRYGRHCILVRMPDFRTPHGDHRTVMDRVVDYVDIQRAQSRDMTIGLADDLMERYISEFPDLDVKVGAGFVLAHLERMIMAYDMWEDE